jgi:hypothetical protein
MDEPTPEAADKYDKEDILPSFSIQWVKSLMDGYFERKGKDPQKINIIDLKVQKNPIQGILSTAYLIDVLYKDDNPPLGKYIYLAQAFKGGRQYTRISSTIAMFCKCFTYSKF